MGLGNVLSEISKFITLLSFCPCGKRVSFPRFPVIGSSLPSEPSLAEPSASTCPPAVCKGVRAFQMLLPLLPVPAHRQLPEPPPHVQVSVYSCTACFCCPKSGLLCSCCCDELPNTSWLKTTQSCYLSVQELRRLEWVTMPEFPVEARGENPFPGLL